MTGDPASRRFAVRRAALSAACVMLALLIAGPPGRRAAAGTGGIVTLPAGGAKPTHGLQLEFDTRWTNGYGYRPVRLHLSTWPPGTKASADRVLRVELTPNSGQRDYVRGDTKVTLFVELPQGRSSADATLLTPVERAWDWLELNVYEDGKRLNELSFSTTGSGLRWLAPTGSSIQLSALIVDADAPPLRERSGNLSRFRGRRGLADKLELIDALIGTQLGGSAFGHVDDERALEAIRGDEYLEIAPPADMPDEWLGLSEVDILFVSLADLQSLAAQSADRLTALRAWLASGTTLCVSDVATAGDRRRLEQLLGLTGGASPAAGDSLAAANSAEAAGEDGAAQQRDDSRPLRNEHGWTQGRMREPFFMHAYGLGTVSAFEGAFSTAAMPNDGNWIGVIPRHGAWTTRHGLEPHESNPGFSNWLIPGVGCLFLIYLGVCRLIVVPLRRLGNLGPPLGLVVMLVLLLVGTFLPLVIAEMREMSPADFDITQLSSIPAVLEYLDRRVPFSTAQRPIPIVQYVLPAAAGAVLLLNLLFVGEEVRREREATPKRVSAERQAAAARQTDA